METRNQAWANDTSTFGYQMLVKMGWSEGKGLGRNEDGISSHIRVKRKAISSGIGVDEDIQGNSAFVNQIDSFNQVLQHLNNTESPSETKPKKLKLTKKKKKKKDKKSVKRKQSKVLAAKNVSSYSSADLKAILGGWMNSRVSELDKSIVM